MTAPANLLEVMRLSDDEAREYLEGVRWPDGARCPHCGSENVGRVEAKATSRKPARKGLWKCYAPECGAQFTVTVGTVMESTHIPLGKWIVAFHLMCSSKKGVSSCQLQRTLDVTYKTAWFMSHRIRCAMNEEPLKGHHAKLTGTVEIDETYVGGKPRKGVRKPEHGDAPWRRTTKTPVFALVQRGGQARAQALQRVSGRELTQVIVANVDASATVNTDESPNYKALPFAKHDRVNHGPGEYARGAAHINTAESFFALVKRAHYGTHHHYSKKHLPKYVTEREFMWNHRASTDPERRDAAIKAGEGKRMTYREPASATKAGE